MTHPAQEDRQLLEHALRLRSVHDDAVREVSIKDDAIRLGQLLKLADVVDAGSDVKVLLRTGQVRVNGEVETRRGRQLVRGDEIVVSGERLRIA